jgi:choline kinase
MLAKDHMDGGFLMVYSDVLFDSDILSHLIGSGKDVVLGIDNSYKYHQHEVNKLLDLVVTSKTFDTGIRSLRRSSLRDVVRIGKNIDFNVADAEFIGMAYFSEQAAKALIGIYDDNVPSNGSSFHEAASFAKASVTDMVLELLDRGFPVHGLEINWGWREIHTREDLAIAQSEIAGAEQPV